MSSTWSKDRQWGFSQSRSPTDTTLSYPNSRNFGAHNIPSRKYVNRRFGFGDDLDSMGNIIIKIENKLGGSRYLNENLLFTSDRSDACKFYLLKDTNSSIFNGDRVTLNTGNRTLIIDDRGIPQLLNRMHIHDEIQSFIVTTGSEDHEPLGCEIPLYFMNHDSDDSDQTSSGANDRSDNMCLQYRWTFDEGKPLTSSPHLAYSSYNEALQGELSTFLFKLEKYHSPLSARLYKEAEITPMVPETSTTERNKALVLILLIAIIMLGFYIISS